MRVRKLTAAVGLTAATALAMGGLTACGSKVGQAAVVGGHRISESDLSKYLAPTGPAPSVVSAAAQAGQGVYPKTEVVQILVQQELFERALDKNGGVPGAGTLASLHDQAASTLLGTQLTGAQLDTEIGKQLTTHGTSARFVPVVLRTFELEMALVLKIKAQSQTDVANAVNRLHIKVDVNPRYGKWDPKTASLGSPSDNVPDFLKLGGTSSATTAASAS